MSLDPVYVYFDIDERTMLRLERLSQKTKIPVPWKPSGPRRTTDAVVAGIGKSAVEPVGVSAIGLSAGPSFTRKIGLPVALGLADEDDFEHHGIMNFADNVVNRQTGTLRVRGEFENPDRLLKSGMFCRVQVPIGTPHKAILVADSAISTDQERKYLYVLDSDNKVSQRDIHIGALHGKLREVEGVAVDERVVIEGLQRVKSGGEVTPKEKDMVAEKGTREPVLQTSSGGGAKSSTK